MKKVALHFTFILAFGALTLSCSEKTVSNTSRSSATAADATVGSRQLKVMSYNIHHASPPTKSNTDIDLDAIANVIRNENPDLVALQEVDVNTRRSGPGNQAEALAERLGMKAYFGRAIDYDGGYYGVAILSKYPMSETTVIPLPEDADPIAEDRVLATAKITLPDGKTIRFGTTHIDVRNKENRDQQVRKINEIASTETVPFIVAGDFNSVPESTAIAELDKVFTRTCTTDCEPTIPVINPDRTIDYIAFTKTSPFKIVSQKVIQESYPSDHLPVVAILSY
ncbi:endonuclease/exonuclease/phosphatase family protein [Pontibacter harenae]|uniref:endonuclease/exonuclease/phosphatase family protein n=1 Tax=Pontibacter harenae TaxID=2894083 RepID=UPI001E517C4E|nr:endonuclease/exonuclease/phosphatase family protein [Pontibacter harenae]MCC9168429.1 endonuclease/exonuclease/phosphatase family protein [Pontibacter harenae]